MANEYHNKTLQKLSGSDFEVRDGYTDIRGWDVKNSSGNTIGEVEELLFDPASRKVRYMVVELDDNELGLDEEREVLIPIGVAELHEKDDDVIIPNITAEQLRSLPEYDADNFSADHEHSIRNIFGGAGVGGALAAATGQDAGFYDHQHYDENNLYRNRKGSATDDVTIPIIREELEIGKREVETGGVRVRTQIVEEEAEAHVHLREEQVQVERVPVDRPARDADLRAEEVELTERAEVPVVNKEVRVVEEITLSKEVTEKDETVRDTVRDTDVEIDETGRNRNRDFDADRDRGTVL